MLDFDIWTILFSVINILVLFFFLKKFLFGRVNKILEERAKLVQDDLDNAKAKSEQAQALKE
jgi:F-type H+-transporting ATPase subunit b